MSNETRRCPCQHLPLCFSSFTAAEFGDLHTLSKAGSRAVHQIDHSGYTPLHLSAQHGHVGATALLLQRGANVEGGGTNCGATPLHRASFSGAVATMRLLIHANAHLMAKDVSFGDTMTPLHKAMAGGRPLAVQLLIDALRVRQKLKEALITVDSYNRTPLQVGLKILQGVQKQERENVQRWDEIAGGPADWGQCVQLLQSANQNENSNTSNTFMDSSSLSDIPRNSLVLESSDTRCLDCVGVRGDGTCGTASWESAFRSVLMATVSSQLQRQRVTPPLPMDPEVSNSCGPVPPVVTTLAFPLEHDVEPVEPDRDSLVPRGRPCSICQKHCFALFRSRVGNGLVCRSCYNDKG